MLKKSHGLSSVTSGGADANVNHLDPLKTPRTQTLLEEYLCKGHNRPQNPKNPGLLTVLYHQTGT